MASFGAEPMDLTVFARLPAAPTGEGASAPPADSALDDAATLSLLDLWPSFDFVTRRSKVVVADGAGAAGTGTDWLEDV